MPEPFAPLPEPPYYAVIFATDRTAAGGGEDYRVTGARMAELATRQPGYIGVEYAGDTAGFEITVRCWRDLDSIAAWKAVAEHRIAQETGKARWFKGYTLRVAKIERAHAFGAAAD